MASERIFDGRIINKASKLISSLSGIIADWESPTTPSGLYGFSAVIETDKTFLDSSTFDFEFDIPFDDDMVPNEAVITIYNLSAETASNFKKDNILTVTAGYGTDVGIILKGRISNAVTKHDGIDKVTTVHVLDDVDYTDSTIAEQTFSENTNASEILKWLIEKLSLPIEIFKIQRDHNYENTTTVKGSITDNIKTYADVCGVSVYVNRQRMFCRPIWDGDNTWFTICANTGMIDSPEPFEETNTSEEYKDTVKGYNISMLLQHRMNTAAIVAVSSKDYMGNFRVCSGVHTFDGLSAITEIKCIADISTEIVETNTDKSGLDLDANSTENDVTWVKKEVPLGKNNYPKTYMSYRLYTDDTASGYKYLHGNESWTNDVGIRMYRECICIAMGSYYGPDGTFVKVEWTNPDGSTKTIICVKGDQKRDSETDSKHQYHPMDGGCGSVCEFIVDGQLITSQSKMYSVLKESLGLDTYSYISNIWTTNTYPYASYGGSTSSIVENIIQIAEKEIGTAEKGDNDNKYGAALGNNYAPWCGLFVAWCIKQVTGATPGFNYASALSYAYAAQNNGWGTYHAQGSGYEPKRGDIFVYNYNGSDYRSDSHVGFVRSSNGSTFVTVEGNSSNKVNTRTLNSAGYTFVTMPY